MVGEMQKDTSRLEKITDRFSKIGSKPALKKTDLTKILTDSLEYMRNRGPESIEYLLDIPEKPIRIRLNETFLNGSLRICVKMPPMPLREVEGSFFMQWKLRTL